MYINFVIFIFFKFHYSVVCSLQSFNHLLGKDWPLGCLVCCVFVTLQYSVPGQAWYFIVSIPDIYLPLYKSELLSVVCICTGR